MSAPDGVAACLVRGETVAVVTESIDGFSVKHRWSASC